MRIKPALAAFAVSLAAASPALAADVVLNADGVWLPFAVDSLLADPTNLLGWIDDTGEALTFTFSVAADSIGTLTVVDASFAGDMFMVTNFGSMLGQTSVVPVGSLEASADVGLDYDAALANPDFSRGVYTFGAGDYRIGGWLTQSATFDGQPLYATAGGLNLTVSAVPEPASVALLVAGLGVLGAARRRRKAI